jgi:hypothetical protein
MVRTSRQRCGTSAIEGVGHDTKTPLYKIKYRIKSLPNKLGDALRVFGGVVILSPASFEFSP